MTGQTGETGETGETSKTKETSETDIVMLKHPLILINPEIGTMVL
jgi:hypothetical protein